MSNEASSKNEKAKVFQALLSSPGMHEKCKINLLMSRQHILLLGRLIESGLLENGTAQKDDIIAALQEGSVEEFSAIHQEILRKGELTEFYNQLKNL